jgi:hypothetical protein
LWSGEHYDPARMLTINSSVASASATAINSHNRACRYRMA